MQQTVFLQDFSRPSTRPLQAVNLQEQSVVSNAHSTMILTLFSQNVSLKEFAAADTAQAVSFRSLF